MNHVQKLVLLVLLLVTGCYAIPGVDGSSVLAAATPGNSPAPTVNTNVDAGVTPSGYPAWWVRCTLTEAEYIPCGLRYHYACSWADSDCPGGIGDPVICLPTESPGPYDYGYCAMWNDRSKVTCTGIIGGPQPTLTK